MVNGLGVVLTMEEVTGRCSGAMRGTAQLVAKLL